MRVRQCQRNCSFGLSFEEFEEKIINNNFDWRVIFTDDGKEEFMLCTLTGEVVDVYDVFFESESERLAFIDWVSGLGY